jgi:hypothetical protein
MHTIIRSHFVSYEYLDVKSKPSDDEHECYEQSTNCNENRTVRMWVFKVVMYAIWRYGAWSVLEFKGSHLRRVGA